MGAQVAQVDLGGATEGRPWRAGTAGGLGPGLEQRGMAGVRYEPLLLRRIIGGGFTYQAN